MIKKKIKNKIKYNKKFSLFKNIFILRVNKNLFYNLKFYTYGIGIFKLYILLFLSNNFSYLSIYKLTIFSIIGIRFSLSSLFLCLKKELYKKNLLLQKYKLKK
ncbi:hypothetical protein (apicoplast) [Babesia microti strain RI]|uniref:Uncharacterized protein n=1 Tax=Babesia microti (strain RI) TaxID=1133968 RepID=A0A068W984_BABMR|nr:hypothetical protein [Babesia microti strain RI]CDR32601.1 hypothetical protein [Babesia microti strain RI]|eukprot:YP_009363170.1 hypothetical protein (apicoplast) [Babesia microti strain RI]